MTLESREKRYATWPFRSIQSQSDTLSLPFNTPAHVLFIHISLCGTLNEVWLFQRNDVTKTQITTTNRVNEHSDESVVQPNYSFDAFDSNDIISFKYKYWNMIAFV